MPKIKTHRGAAKRFNKTGNGKVSRAKAFKQHILTSKTTKRQEEQVRKEHQKRCYLQARTGALRQYQVQGWKSIIRIYSH